MSNSMIFGDHFESMQIGLLRRQFLVCQRWFWDSAYQITNN